MEYTRMRRYWVLLSLLLSADVLRVKPQADLEKVGFCSQNLQNFNLTSFNCRQAYQLTKVRLQKRNSECDNVRLISGRNYFAGNICLDRSDTLGRILRQIQNRTNCQTWCNSSFSYKYQRDRRVEELKEACCSDTGLGTCHADQIWLYYRCGYQQTTVSRSPTVSGLITEVSTSTDTYLHEEDDETNPDMAWLWYILLSIVVTLLCLALLVVVLRYRRKLETNEHFPSERRSSNNTPNVQLNIPSGTIPMTSPDIRNIGGHSQLPPGVAGHQSVLNTGGVFEEISDEIFDIPPAIVSSAHASVSGATSGHDGEHETLIVDNVTNFVSSYANDTDTDDNDTILLDNRLYASPPDGVTSLPSGEKCHIIVERNERC